MPPSRLSIPKSALLLLLALLPASVLATVSMQNVQPIVGFSTQCTDAYNTNVDSCSVDDFKGIGKSGSCSQQCFTDLITLQSLIGQDCQGQKASGDSLIGHFFTQTGPQMLCGFDSGSGSATSSSSSDSSSSTSTSTSVSSSSASSSSSSSSASATSTTSSSSSSSSSTSTASVSTSTSTLFSGTSTGTLSTSTSTQTSAHARKTGQVGLTGGGSPFDMTLPNAASRSSSGVLLWATSLCLGLGLVLVR